MLVARITPWIVPVDYEQNLVGRHFVTIWGKHLLNLFRVCVHSTVALH
jgi:hypothetical protein